MGETFHRDSAGEVWAAMVTAAKTPVYDDWKVLSNDVHVIEAQRRLEIYRQVERVLYRADAPPHREERTWRFAVILRETDPPRAEFTSRGFGMPTEAQAESRRYFAEVYDVLAGVPLEAAVPQDEEVIDSMGLDDEDRADD